MELTKAFVKENDLKGTVKKAQFSQLQPVNGIQKESSIDLLEDIEIEIEVELGSSIKSLGEVLELEEDSVIILNKVAGDTVDLYIKNEWFASGEVVVLNEQFGVRISSINKGEDSN